MKKNILILSVNLFILTGTNVFADDITDEALRIYYSGERSQAMNMFYDIYKNDHNNAEALYEIAVYKYEDKQINKEQFINKITEAIKLAFESKDQALAHYFRSQMASKTDDLDLALEEINLALEIEPTSVRYHRGKMLFLSKKAKKLKNKEIFYDAIDSANNGIESVKSDPKKYFTTGSLHFEIARWVHGCCSTFNEFRDISIEHYKNSIELNEMSETKLSYAWNNMSYQLYKQGRCKEAKDAAENALKIFTYGNAFKNLETAKNCLADNNIFYKIWYKIESWTRILLSMFK